MWERHGFVRVGTKQERAVEGEQHLHGEVAVQVPRETRARGGRPCPRPRECDVVEYPESEKLAAAVGKFPTGNRYVFPVKDQVDYFHGDRDAEE